MPPEVSCGLGNPFLSELPLEVIEGTDNPIDPSVVFEENTSQLLEAKSRFARPVAIRGRKGLAQVLGGMEEVDDLLADRDLPTEELPVILGTVGDLDDGQVWLLLEDPAQLREERRLECELLTLGAYARSG
jgi:hypothetical protein